MKQFAILVLPALTLLFAFAGCSSSKPDSEKANRAQVLMIAGIESLEKREYAAALRVLQDASKLEPKNPELFSNMGVAYMGKEEPNRAEESFKKALSLDKDFNDARLNLGVLYIRQKRYPEAEQTLRAAAKDLAYDKGFQVAFQLANLYLELNRPLLAEQQLKVAVRENPSFCPAWFRLGLIQKERGDYLEAAKSLSTSLKGICYKNPQAHYEIASLYIKANEVPIARKKLLEIIQLFPSSEWAEKSEITLNMIR
jgi:Tfp pilus assembly protein PilF